MLNKIICVLVVLMVIYIRPAYALDSYEIISQINSVRHDHGLAKLSSKPRLAQAAQAKANDMVANNYWSHTSPSGKTPWSFIKASRYSYRTAGENLYKGEDSATTAVALWLNSAAHRQNILASKYVDTGVGVAYSPDTKAIIIVQMFAAPR